jgi:AraC-like DNA-binding protein
MLFEVNIPGLNREVDQNELALLAIVKAEILKNLGNTYYGSEELAKAVGCSSSMLARKLRGITSYSPARLIRYFRMEYATFLLSETNDSIKVIAMKTGFPEQANFCRTFKKCFNSSPSEFRDSLRKPKLSFEFHCSIPMTQKDVLFITWLASEHPWLNNVLNIVLANFQNDAFGANQLAEELCISKSQLNRKLNALLKLSASRFIKYIRLQHAAELLVYENDSVGVVAYRTGFFDHAHFCRSFKAAFQCAPRMFRQHSEDNTLPKFVSKMLVLHETDK